MASSYRLGMDRLLSGVVRYRNTFKGQMVKEFERVRDSPDPSALFFTCVDSRMLPSRFTQTHVGDMFIARNVGNVIPHSSRSLAQPMQFPSTEPALLELGVVMQGIQHVVVCGHSDCKAVNLLYTAHEDKGGEAWGQESVGGSPLRSWMSRHGMGSLERFERLKESKFRQPLVVQGESPGVTLKAFIDVDDKFNEADKLSQVHALVQAENVASYGFLRDHIRDFKVHLHVMWFDIYTGEIYYFSRKNKCFVPITDRNHQELLDELEWKYRRKREQDGGFEPERDAQKIIEVGNREKSGHREGGCSGHGHGK